MQEVKLQSERQDVLSGMVVSKRDVQKEAPKKYQEKVFEEFKELEEQSAKEAPELVQKRSICSWKMIGRERESCKDWEDRER